MTQLISTVRTAARLRFKGQSPRVWFCMMAPEVWRALVINAEEKLILEEITKAKSAKDALQQLKHKLQPGIKKTGGR